MIVGRNRMPPTLGVAKKLLPSTGAPVQRKLAAKTATTTAHCHKIPRGTAVVSAKRSISSALTRFTIMTIASVPRQQSTLPQALAISSVGPSPYCSGMS